MAQATASVASSMTTTAYAITADDGGLATKRRKFADQSNDESLFEGLPDDIAQLCLSRVPPAILYSVSRSWRRLIYSPSFPPFLSLYALLLPTQTSNQKPIEFASFDPISSRWHALPPPPSDPPLRPVFRHPSFLSRTIPIQSVSVSGSLVLLAATTDNFLPALPRPLVFSPNKQKWVFGPPLCTPRRWCAAGASRGVVYVGSGIGSQFNTEVARSVEKWDLRSSHDNPHHRKIRTSCRSGCTCFELGWNWEKLCDLRDGKFSRDAVDAVAWRGKLCMVNVKGNSAKEGLVYDVERDAWQEMPEGMIAGWRGPAASMDEETLYVVDESKGMLRKYDALGDRWEEILGAEERLRGAEQIAAAGGRVCVICGGGKAIVVVDVVASPARFCVIDTPIGFEAVAVHILPRMSRKGLSEE